MPDLSHPLDRGGLSGGWYRTRKGGWEPYCAPARTGQTEALCHGCDLPHEGGALCPACRAGIAWLVARCWPDPGAAPQRPVAEEVVDPLPGVAGTLVRLSPKERMRESRARRAAGLPPRKRGPPKGYVMSEESRARMRAAALDRWRRVKYAQRAARAVPPVTGRGRYARTPAIRAAISAGLARRRQWLAAQADLLVRCDA